MQRSKLRQNNVYKITNQSVKWTVDNGANHATNNRRKRNISTRYLVQ